MVIQGTMHWPRRWGGGGGGGARRAGDDKGAGASRAAVLRWASSPLIRLCGFALVLLTLLLLLTAPAARGVAAGPGDCLWMSWLDGPDHTLDAVTSVAEAPDGSLYAAGVANDDWGTAADILVIKRTPNGTGGWSLEWDGPAGNADWAADLVVDAESNAIVVGRSVSVAKQEDWALVKYSPAGVVLWQKLWGGTSSDVPVDAVGDAAGNVFVCGTADFSQNSSTWKVVKFRRGSGSVAWTLTYTGPAANTSGDMPLAMDRDAAGNLYVAGTSANKLGVRDIVVIKVSPTGKRLWARRIDGPSHLADEGVAVAARPEGGAYVACHSWTGTAQNQMLLVRLTASGSYAWTGTWKRWDDATVPGMTSVEGMDLDADGNVYVAGYSWDSGATDYRAFIQKRSPAGALRWVRYHRPAGVENSAFHGLAVSSVGRAWVAGTVIPAGGTQDWLVARYETDGKRAWVSSYDSTSHLADWANALTLCGTRSLFVGGVMGTSTNDDAGTAKYLR